MEKIFIYGAGEAGRMVLHEIRRYTDLGLEVIGFFDDDSHKYGRKVDNVSIVGGLDNLHELERHNINELLIAMPSASKKRIRQIVETVKDFNKAIRIRIVPGTREIISGDVKWNQIKDVSIEDLLGRESVSLNDAVIKNYISGKKVLVTGAGGSIGSEIVRQILKYGAKVVAALGRGENSIYELLNDLKFKDYNTESLIPVIGNITDKKRLKYIFDTIRPDIVFHAAAHKHVPLMENNTHEAFLNNVIGSMNVFDAAVSSGVQKVVSISTDKAVRPTSVMGATKRMIEIILQIYAEQFKNTEFSAVRFGNVLGSRGSVIPLFKKQIEQGGPVTVTHEDVIRFFMTIPEAVSLVLQAGALGKNGEIFVLDMGEPIRIYDLAVNLIKLSGLRLGEDIDIEITGLRPGEKLFEEILTEEEGIAATKYEKIFVAKPEKYNKDKLDDIRTINENLYFYSAAELKKEIFKFIN